MSLENEIKNLTAAVVALTERIGQLEAPTPVAKGEGSVEVEAVKPTPKAKVAKKEAVKEVVAADDTITAESLQALCMTIVKADRSKGPTIKAMIAEFDGAKTIKAVNPDQFPLLKEALENLINE